MVTFLIHDMLRRVYFKLVTGTKVVLVKVKYFVRSDFYLRNDVTKDFEIDSPYNFVSNFNEVPGYELDIPYIPSLRGHCSAN